MTVVGRIVAAGAFTAGSIALCWPAHAAVTAGQVTSSPSAGFASQTAFLADSSGQITSPSDGQVVSGSSVMVSASTGLVQLKMGLYVEGPSTPSRLVASGGAGQTISGTFETGDGPNGSFTVTLKGELTGSTYATSTFKVRRPPETPGNVNVSRQGTEQVAVTWSRGTEPDLQSYEVSNTQSGIVGRMPADSACSGSSCKAVLAVPGRAAGQRVGFTVKAFRGDGDGGSIESGASAPAYVVFPAVASAKPTKKADSTTKSRDGRGAEALPTLPAKRQSLPSAKPTARKQTAMKLPEIPDADPNGNLPIPSADQAGQDGDLVPADGADSAPVRSDAVKAQSNESGIGNVGQYGLYVAGGILLLLFGAHAGAWARRRALATGGGPTHVHSVTPEPVAPPAPEVLTKQSSPPTAASVRRRPAVILAVAKTRVPEQTPSPRALTPEPDVVTAREAQRQGLGADTTSPRAGVRERRSEQVGEGEPRPGRAGEATRRSERTAEGARRAEKVGRLPYSAPEGVAATSSMTGRVREVPSGQVRGVDEAREAVHIRLPSSAVSEVAEPSAPVVKPLVRLDERWDDYLPPSPKSMEDSGFWERPQPGADDFWAADDEGDAGEGDAGDGDGARTYAARRNRGGEG